MTKKNNKFLLLSLNDKKTQKIGNILNNKTSKSILDYITDNDDSTATQIAKATSSPLPTVHYNLKILLDTGIIEWENYSISEKGKEVKHYKAANKAIIIVPKNDPNFLEKLKNMIPSFLITTLGTFGIYLSSRFQNYSIEIPEMIREKSAVVIENDISLRVMNSPEEISAIIYQPSIWEIVKVESAFWFLCGALISIIIYLIYMKLKKINQS